MRTLLPSDLTVDELNAMVAALGEEMGVPYGVHPDLVDSTAEPEPYHDAELYRAGQRWRRKIIAELKKRPEWIAEFRAAAEMDRRVEELCRAKGLTFAPWELPPWHVQVDDEPHPTYPPGHGVRLQWPLAQRLRRELEAELEAEERR
jgi:hypothetical protein